VVADTSGILINFAYQYRVEDAPSADTLAAKELDRELAIRLSRTASFDQILTRADLGLLKSEAGACADLARLETEQSKIAQQNVDAGISGLELSCQDITRKGLP
jgi:hypothetical protein